MTLAALAALVFRALSRQRSAFLRDAALLLGLIAMLGVA